MNNGSLIEQKDDNQPTAGNDCKEEEEEEENHEWMQYRQQIKQYWDHINHHNDPSLFALSSDVQYYLQCCSCPLPSLSLLPKLSIPLHIYICRHTNHFQCSSDLNPTTICNIIHEINVTYWTKYANIVFDCSYDTIYDISLSLDQTQHDHYIQSIYHSTDTNPRHRRRHRHRHRVDQQKGGNMDPSHHLCYFHQLVRDTITKHNSSSSSSFSSSSSSSAIRICFVDCIGPTLQGICLSSPKPMNPYRLYHYHNNKNSNKKNKISTTTKTTRNDSDDDRIDNNQLLSLPMIFIGERSNKGYIHFTKRPHTCLAKTLGHELGHALSLKHIRNQVSDHVHMKQDIDDDDIPTTATTSPNRTETLTTTTQQQQQHTNRIPKNCSNLPNLMEGGQDQFGGGGYHLEQWQICMARDVAEYGLLS
jgi:hypothetical protein